ncbi:unnamed protein product, partial [Meganyctiphanes norvegica]
QISKLLEVNQFIVDSCRSTLLTAEMDTEQYLTNGWNVMEQVHENNDETTAEELIREVTPLLERVAVLGPGDHEDPAVRQLFEWLADPERTVDEFNYIVGPLRLKVYHDTSAWGLRRDRLDLYMGIQAAEALAVRTPVLVGQWEHAAWLVVQTMENLAFLEGTPSLCLSDYVIRMMGDTEFCPNPYLRLQFVRIFPIKVQVNANNQKQAFDAVMFACYTLSTDPIQKFIYGVDTYGYGDLWSIIGSLDIVSKDGYLQEFDQQLSDKLQSMVSAMHKDVSCSYSLNPNRNTFSYELNIVTGIFQTISGLLNKNCRRFKRMGTIVTKLSL